MDCTAITHEIDAVLVGNFPSFAEKDRKNATSPDAGTPDSNETTTDGTEAELPVPTQLVGPTNWDNMVFLIDWRL
jgi:hypothetical protein